LGTTKSYYLQFKEPIRYPYLASSLAEDEQFSLASICTFSERNGSEFRWLQTCYFDKDSNSTDQAHDGLFKKPGLQYIPELVEEGSLLFDDVARYNFGSDWQKIFSRIPQLVDTFCDPESFAKGKSNALQEVHDIEEAERHGRSRNIRPIRGWHRLDHLVRGFPLGPCHRRDMGSR